MDNPGLDSDDITKNVNSEKHQNGHVISVTNGLRSHSLALNSTSPTGAKDEVKNGKRFERVLSVEDEVEERRRAQREKEPFIYIRWIVNRPKTWFCGCLTAT